MIMYDNDIYNYYNNNCYYYDKDYFNYVKNEVGYIIEKLFDIKKNTIILEQPIYEKFMQGNRKNDVLNYKRFSLISPQIFNIVYVYLVFIRQYDKNLVKDKISNYVEDNKNRYKKECQLEYEREMLEKKRMALYLKEQEKIEDERLAREQRIRKMLNENNTF